jgi:YVTN family beta-propeller protein
MRRVCLLILLLGLAWACDNNSGPGSTLEVTPDSVQLVRNDSVRLSVSVVDKDGRLLSNVAITFESEDTSIVTVSNLGTVRAGVKLGRATVHVRGGGAERNIPVLVYVPPAYIVVGPNDTLISPNQTVQMHATIFDANSIPIADVVPTWESSAPTLVSVSATGLVRGDSAGGEAFIIAHAGSVSGSGHVRVRGPTTIVVTPGDTTIAQGDSAQFRAKVYDQAGDSIPGLSLTWETSNPAVVTVSATGRARTISGRSGQLTISARYGFRVGAATLTVTDTSILGNRVAVPGNGYGAAISVNSVAYITMPNANLLARADLPSQTFTTMSSGGENPAEVVFNATGTRLYITNQLGGTVTVIDVATNSVIDTIAVGSRPYELLFQPGDSILWVGKIDSLYAVRLATKEIIARFSIGHLANGLAIVRDTLLYASTHESGTIVEINLRTRTVGRTFNVGGIPQKIVTSTDGNELYIANQAGYVQFWNLNTGTQRAGNIPLTGAGAYGIAVRPTTGMLYVTTFYSGGGQIIVIDPALHAAINAVVAGGDTRRVVFSASGVGFVPNGNGWVDFIK